VPASSAALPPLIDVHMHYGRLYLHDEPQGLTPEALLKFMDDFGIERAALLPIESPEEAHFYVTTEYAVEIARRHPDRFIPFCNVDPRIGSPDNADLIRGRLAEHKEQGCRGYGEAMTGLWVDDERLQRVYEACGELSIPIIFHFDSYRNRDDKGLPRFEKMLRKFPDTIFVGHGQHFWAEISGDVTEEEFGTYPERPVAPGGAVPRLMEQCPNLYADLSAGSAFNGLTRDPEFGFGFLEKWQDRLMFATDICVTRHLPTEPRIIGYLRSALQSGRIDEAAAARICRENAVRVFDLDA